jgi:hypothetical protein
MITQERLKEVMRYDPETGVFTWLIAVGRGPSRRQPGDTAGNDNHDGAIRITYNGEKYLAHRLAWFYMTGRWPKPDCDHQDRDRANNRWSNLREATHSQNLANTTVRKNSKSGIKGVCWNVKSRKWQASITVDYHQRSLGYFDCPAAAHLAYCLEAHKAFGPYARTA